MCARAPRSTPRRWLVLDHRLRTVLVLLHQVSTPHTNADPDSPSGVDHLSPFMGETLVVMVYTYAARMRWFQADWCRDGREKHDLLICR